MLICINAYAVKTNILYEANYGKSIDQYGYDFVDYIDECSAIPASFYVCKNDIYIQDQNNHRIQIIPKNNDIWHVKQDTYIESVLETDSIIYSDKSILKFGSTLSDTLFAYNKKDETFSYKVAHPKGYVIVASNFKQYCFDSTYTLLRRPELPKFIKPSGVVYFTDEKAMISNSFESLKKYIKNNYYELAGIRPGIPIPEILEFPDSTEWGAYFSKARAGVSMQYLGVDSLYNTFWSTGRYAPEDKNNHYSGVFSYDRLGKLRFWFPEPLFENGWKKYCGDIVVNEEGRIFQMVFYSKFDNFAEFKKKKNLDSRKGIRILEYIPEKDDFTHKGRVRMYGGKK